MIRSILILLCTALPLMAQSQTPSSTTSTSRNPNFGANKIAGGAVLPASCTESQLYFKTGVGAYQCVGGTWREMAAKGTDGSLSIGATVLGPKTIGAGANQLPAAAAGNSGQITVVTDAASGSDCTAGGGTSAALCRSDGSAWVPLGGAGGEAASPCAKYTTPYTSLTAAAATQTIDLVAAAQGTRLTGITIKEGTQFSGTGITALTVSIGNKAGTVTEYAPAYSLLQVPSDSLYYDAQVYGSATWAAHTISAKFTATGGNLNALTAGSVDIWVCKVVLP